MNLHLAVILNHVVAKFRELSVILLRKRATVYIVLTSCHVFIRLERNWVFLVGMKRSHPDVNVDRTMYMPRRLIVSLQVPHRVFRG